MEAEPPEHARDGHFGLRFLPDLHAPLDALPIAHVVAAAVALGVVGDELETRDSGGASARPPGPSKKLRDDEIGGVDPERARSTCEGSAAVVFGADMPAHEPVMAANSSGCPPAVQL